MFKFSAVSQIWNKYIQKLNAWDLSLKLIDKYWIVKFYFITPLIFASTSLK